MRISAATAPKEPGRPNEDALVAAEGLLAVVDGATERTGTGCVEGTAWYATQLANRLHARAGAAGTLTEAVAGAIGDVVALHDPACDLTHPGSPSALLAAVRCRAGRLEWLVLGDVTVMIATRAGVAVHAQDHGHIAAAARAEANAYPLGDPRKNAIMEQVKQAEHAARNQPGGYWAASVDPAAAAHALTGTVPLDEVAQVLIVSDGITRLVDLFGSCTYPELIAIAAASGPAALIDRVRALEDDDPQGAAFPRSKRCDDATGVHACWLAAP